MWLWELLSYRAASDVNARFLHVMKTVCQMYVHVRESCNMNDVLSSVKLRCSVERTSVHSCDKNVLVQMFVSTLSS
jgi:hypothetical protein